MWHEELPPEKSWASLWSSYILCGECSGIRPVEGACPACGVVLQRQGMQKMLVGGREVLVNADIYQGPEGRFEDYVYLRMLEREWKRLVGEEETSIFPDPDRRPSARAGLVVQFWTYFETRVERLLRAGKRDVPPRIVEDLLQRYASIGARMDRLYRVLFETTYAADLTDLGYGDIARHLAHVQERRNAFAHGEPGAINDALVKAVVDNLKREHDGWIAVFNCRGAESRRSEQPRAVEEEE
jgi:hypothetical protein